MPYKGSYIVNENGARPLSFKDNSFQLCVGTMLVFIFLCTVLITASLIFWNKSGSKTDKLLGIEEDRDNYGKDKLKNVSKPFDDEKHSSKKNDSSVVGAKPRKDEEDGQPKLNKGVDGTESPTNGSTSMDEDIYGSKKNDSSVVDAKPGEDEEDDQPKLNKGGDSTESPKNGSTSMDENISGSKKNDTSVVGAKPGEDEEDDQPKLNKGGDSTKSPNNGSTSMDEDISGSKKNDSSVVGAKPGEDEKDDQPKLNKGGDGTESPTNGSTSMDEDISGSKKNDSSVVGAKPGENEKDDPPKLNKGGNGTESPTNGSTSMDEDISGSKKNDSSVVGAKPGENEKDDPPKLNKGVDGTESPTNGSTSMDEDISVSKKNDSSVVGAKPGENEKDDPPKLNKGGDGTESPTNGSTSMDEDISGSKKNDSSVVGAKPGEDEKDDQPKLNKGVDGTESPKNGSTSMDEDISGSKKNDSSVVGAKPGENEKDDPPKLNKGVDGTESPTNAFTSMDEDISGSKKNDSSVVGAKPGEDEKDDQPKLNKGVDGTESPKNGSTSMDEDISGSKKNDSSVAGAKPGEDEKDDPPMLNKDDDVTESPKNGSTSNDEENNVNDTSIVNFKSNEDLGSYICTTSKCKNSASRMLALMDHSADACDDFYQYACGGMTSNRVEEKNLEKNVTDILDNVGKLKSWELLNKFYLSCVNKSESSPYHEVVFTEIQKDLNDTSAKENKAKNLAILLSNILRKHPHYTPSHPLPIVDIVVDADDAYPQHFIPVIVQPYYESVLNNADNNDIYKKECFSFLYETSDFKTSYEQFKNCSKDSILYMKNLNASFKYFNLFDKETDEDKQMRTYFNIDDLNREIDASSHRLKLNISQNFYEEHAHYYTIAELAYAFPVVDWELLFNRLFSSKPIDLNQKIKILSKEYFAKIMKFYNEREFETIKNILLGIISHDLYIEFVESKIIDRPSYCKEIIINLMDDIVYNKYKVEILEKNTYLDQSYLEVNKLFKNIKSKMSQLLNEYAEDNLEAEDLTKLQKKLSDIRLIIDTKKLYNDPEVHLNYNSISLSNDFMENVMSLKQNLRNKMYKNFNELINIDDVIWKHFTSPLSTRPFVHINLNAIVVSPIVLFDLLPSYGHSKKQRYQQMADLGFLLGQQLATFFTPINMRKILNVYPGDYVSFVSQLNTPQILHFEYYNEKLTKEDVLFSSEKRFADDSGFNLLYKVFTDSSKTPSDIENYQLPWVNMELNNTKIFFILLAQNFCERSEKLTKQNFIMNLYENDELQSNMRVNSMMCNSKDMTKVFDCLPGTNMNPSLKFGQFPDIKMEDDIF